MIADMPATIRVINFKSSDMSQRHQIFDPSVLWFNHSETPQAGKSRETQTVSNTKPPHDQFYVDPLGNSAQAFGGPGPAASGATPNIPNTFPSTRNKCGVYSVSFVFTSVLEGAAVESLDNCSGKSSMHQVLGVCCMRLETGDWCRREHARVVTCGRRGS